MLEDTFLSLSGHAYLHGIRCYQNDEFYATFNLIYQLNGSRSDNVWLKCQFNRNQFPVLTDLYHYLSEDTAVIVKFDVKYAGFEQCYAGITKDDPRSIVHIHGELLTIYEYCYVKSAKAFHRNPHDPKNFSIWHKV